MVEVKYTERTSNQKMCPFPLYRPQTRSIGIRRREHWIDVVHHQSIVGEAQLVGFPANHQGSLPDFYISMPTANGAFLSEDRDPLCVKMDEDELTLLEVLDENRVAAKSKQSADNDEDDDEY